MINSITRDYENAVLDLLFKKAFFAKVIMSMRKDFNWNPPPPYPNTAAVSVNSTGITLHINKDFFASLSPKERVAIMEHEVLHLVHGHPVRTQHFKPEDRMLANVAQDIAINQFIPDLPLKFKSIDHEGNLTEGQPVTYELVKKEFPDIKPKMDFEYYFNFLKKETEKRKGQGEGTPEFATIDDHGQWGESDMTEEQKEKFTKGHMKAILQGCSDQERSTVDQSIIDELFKSEIDWKQQLRQFFANSEETYTETTRKKRNRRYGIIQPGHKNESKLKIAVAVDTSCSMSDESLNMIFGEIARIKTENVVVYVIEADMKVQDFYEYKKNMKISAKGRGGTAYNPAFVKGKELKVDAMIYCGDMDASDVPAKPKYPVLWAIIGKQEPPADFGRKMYLP